MAIRSRKHQHRVHSLAALVAATIPGIGYVHAEQAKDGYALPEMVVTEQAKSAYKADRSANAKLAEPLLDTPKTVQVIKQEMLREQGANNLMEALRNTPGITMQLGENGNTAAGDTFMMRGFSTQTSTFVDGVRDLGAISRDIFNLEQVEVVKGATGSDIGRGASSGYINLISKLPTLEDAISGTLGYGTADNANLTADLNQQLGENSALRLNLVRREGGVDGRDYVENSSYGVAPSIAFGLDTPTRLYIYSQHVRQDNRPDGGIPTIGMSGFYSPQTDAVQAARLNLGGKVDREHFYGSSSDYEDVAGDMLTVKLEHDLNDVTTLRNLSRYGRSSMDRVLTGPAGGATSMTAPSIDPSTWAVARTRQLVDQENEILANQTSLSTEFDLGGMRNTLVSGLELMRESQRNESGSTSAQVIGGVAYPAVPLPPANLYNPYAGDLMGKPYKTGAYTDGETKTAAIYLLDTLHLNEQWAINGGLRYEHYDTKTKAATVTAGALVPSRLSESDNLISWNAGVVFKPAANGSLYLAFANSLTPPGSANFALSSSESNDNRPGLDPQETRHVELGTKWDLLDESLALSAAIYRTENSNQVSYDSLSGTYSQDGTIVVKGAEVALVGQITNFWQVSAGIASMDSRQVDDFSRNNAGVVSENTGVRWSPDLTATLWTSYTLGDLTLGGGARYVSEQDRVINGADRSTSNMPSIPSYWVADAMAAYRINDNLNLRLNVYNLFDEEYIATLNNSGARMALGAPRSALLSTEFSF
ncbi:catecholate siderophore receptor Fiu [Pseudomonas mangrovi]|uniref:Catecholate siderophore receptor Fiu n=1 Tax=Pseudomonas mangrovi TaxID=2161748 RepID=A0A2T5PF46_9PSED|nr:catecholate siderophore receptor Fiu [Pseudomonas mangrovi]PTU76342.1 catecholate siderophore receptor Fiu [Pseudomonas mangrovi]